MHRVLFACTVNYRPRPGARRVLPSLLGQSHQGVNTPRLPTPHPRAPRRLIEGATASSCSAASAIASSPAPRKKKKKKKNAVEGGWGGCPPGVPLRSVAPRHCPELMGPMRMVPSAHPHRYQLGRRIGRRLSRALGLLLLALAVLALFTLAPAPPDDLLGGLKRELRPAALREQGGAEGGCLDRLQSRWPGRFQGCGGVPSPCTERAQLYGALGDWQDGELDLRSRSFSVTDLFDFGGIEKQDGGYFVPRLSPLEVPVRVALLLMDEASSSSAMGQVVRAASEAVGEVSDSLLWWQDSSSYHSTLFHASTYDSPVVSGRAQVQAEDGVLKDLSKTACPIQATLERLVLTSSGVVLAGWQVVSGAEPGELRAHLQAHLPLAPAGQKVKNRYILHTTVARLVRRPEKPQSLSAAIGRAGSALCGLEVRFDRLALAEELDLLALGLGGRVKWYPAALLSGTSCST